MRYQNPSIADAVDRLLEEGADRIVAVPLFPQYASASSGTASDEIARVVSNRHNVPEVVITGDFFADPGFIGAVSEIAKPLLDDFGPDHVLFSYHGTPESQVTKGDPTGSHCLTSGCCDRITSINRFCYRAQCFATSRTLGDQLGLATDVHSTSFQSRLAPKKWIEPYTDHVLPRLYEQGVRRLAVFTPSFTIDCLETIEEIGIRGREQWSDLGGDDLLLVPCVNSHPTWAATVARMVRERSGNPTSG